MKCVIVGVEPRDYVKKDGQAVKGMNIYMLADDPNVFGKCFKDCFVSASSPLYVKNMAVFDDMDKLQGREVNAEWDVKMFGSKAVKTLIGFEFLSEAYDLVKRA